METVCVKEMEADDLLWGTAEGRRRYFMLEILLWNENLFKCIYNYFMMPNDRNVLILISIQQFLTSVTAVNDWRSTLTHLNTTVYFMLWWQTKRNIKKTYILFGPWFDRLLQTQKAKFTTTDHISERGAVYCLPAFSLRNDLFICLLIYFFIASGAESMCLIFSHASVNWEKGCCIQVKGRRRRRSVCFCATAAL